MTVIELAIKLAINKLYSEIERQLTFQRGGGGCSEVGYGCKSFISAAAAATTTLTADSCYKKDGGRQKACGAESGHSDPMGGGMRTGLGLQLD